MKSSHERHDEGCGTNEESDSVILTMIVMFVVFTWMIIIEITFISITHSLHTNFFFFLILFLNFIGYILKTKAST